MLKTLAIVSGLVGGGCFGAVGPRAGFPSLLSPEIWDDLDATSTRLALIGIAFVLAAVFAAMGVFTP